MPDTDTSRARSGGTDPASIRDGPDALPLLPLTTGVVLPQMVVTLALETDEARDAADGAAAGGRPRPARAPHVGGRLRPRRHRRPDRERGRAARRRSAPSCSAASPAPSSARPVAERPARACGSRSTPCAEPADASGPRPRAGREYRAIVRGIAERLGAPRIADALAGVDDPGTLADTAGWSPDLVDRAQGRAARDDRRRGAPRARAARGRATTLAELELTEQIRYRGDRRHGQDRSASSCCASSSTRSARSWATGDDDDVVEEYRTKLDALASCPTTCATRSTREVDRLERTSEQSPEHGWIRTWLDTVLELPWGTRSDERPRRGDARAVLDADHTGLDDVKDRIVEYLAVRKLRAERGHRATTRPSASRRRARSSRWSVLPASARRRSASRSRARSAASSSASPSAACATRPRSAGTGAPTSARAPAASCAR